MRLKDTLGQVELFQQLPPAVLDELIQRGSKLRVGPGRVLVQQGSPESGLQLLLDGSATVSVNGEERGTMTAGQYFGEISLIDSAPRSATVVAGPDGCETFTVSPVAFSGLLDAHPEIARTLLKTLTARIRRLEAAGQ